MNKSEFLQRLFSMFPSNFNENNMGYWLKAYETVLCGNIDFDKLFFIMISRYENICSAPSPKWLKDNLQDAIIKNKKSLALVHIENINREEREPMSEETKRKLNQLIQKMSMG